MSARKTLLQPIRRMITMAGTRVEAARLLQITPAAIWLWEHETQEIPLERVPDVERVFGIPAIEQRPDYFGRLQSLHRAA